MRVSLTSNTGSCTTSVSTSVAKSAAVRDDKPAPSAAPNQTKNTLTLKRVVNIKESEVGIGQGEAPKDTASDAAHGDETQDCVGLN